MMNFQPSKTVLKISFLVLLFLAAFLAWRVVSVSKSAAAGEEISLLPSFADGKLSFLAKTDGRSALERLGAPPIFAESLLTGLPSELPVGNVFVVMIDNHRAARAYHSGLEQAALIFEAPAEGGIPRLMALFSENDPVGTIGPVRSTRSYFLDLARPFAPLVAHAGGSPGALGELARSTDFLNLDNELGDDSFWRNKDVAAPHNLFTDLAKLRAYALAKNWQKPLAESVFEYGDVFVGEPLTALTLDFGQKVDGVEWLWDAEKKLFLRRQENEALVIGVNNVVVIFSEQWLLGDDDKARIGVRTTGAGVAYLLRDGRYQKATWSRAENGFFRFSDEFGLPVRLARGKTFVEFLDGEGRVGVVE